MTFGKRLKEIRKEMGHTQEEMSEIYGIGKSTLQRYEKGSTVPGGIFLIDIAIKGYNLHWLMTGDGDKINFKSPSVEPCIREIWNWLEDYSQNDPGYKEWFRIQFEKSFEDFKKWKKEKEEENNHNEIINKTNKID